MNCQYKEELEDQYREAGATIPGEEGKEEEKDPLDCESKEDLEASFSSDRIKDLCVENGLKSGGRDEERLTRLWTFVEAKGDIFKLPKKMRAKK